MTRLAFHAKSDRDGVDHRPPQPKRSSGAGPRTKHIAIIQGHPDPQGHHFCHALAEAYAAGAREAGHKVEVIDVARLEFPLLRSREDLEHAAVPEAIRQSQDALTRSDHVVLIFPVWNGAMPALLKGFLEQTFRSTFIFPDAKPDERLGFASYFSQRKALAGRSGRIVATMQMPAFVYRWYFHPHPEKNTLRVGGIGPIRESLIGLVETPDSRRREGWLLRMRALGRQAR
jgi:putative NADPH-quinone reductase